MTDTIQILIVDDNALNFKIVGTLLKEKGYKIAVATNGSEALDVLSKSRIDLVLLDVIMPGINGFEVCIKIKEDERFKDIPVIFLTACNDTEVLVNCFKSGGVDFINKPFIKEELLARIENHLFLSKSKKEILTLMQNRDKLYSIIAHDIRSPLNNILYTLTLIADGKLNPESDKFRLLISTLVKTSSGLTTLVDNLIDWTKYNYASIEFSRSKNYIFPILKECIAIYGSAAQEKEIRFNLDVKEDLEATFDALSMFTVFRNLISNSIKFSNPKGIISLTSHSSNNMVNIVIFDNGKGMSQETIQKIMVANEPMTSKGTNNERGTGLGLVLVKDFITRNQGKLEIKSKIGIGTEIHVSIPE